MIKAIFVAAALIVATVNNAAAQSAAPDFDVIRPYTEYVNKDGVGNPHVKGDDACLALQEALNSWDGLVYFRNGKFLNKPNYGEGCEFDLYDRKTGASLGRSHYQNWAFSRLACPNGYSGVHYTDFHNSNPHCRRSQPVVKPPSCPYKVLGNPVDVTALDKTLPVSDFDSIDGLGFTRHYRSAQRSRNGYPSPLGNGWYAEHAQSLNINTEPGGMFAPIIQIVMPNGDPLMFIKDATSSLWVSEKDQLCNALVEAALPDGTHGYLLTLKDGEVESFSNDGMLLSIDRPDGTRLTYTYNAAGQLKTATNQKGRFLTFEYAYDRRLSKVIDSTGRFVSYSYNSAGLLESADYGDHQERYVYKSYASNNSLLTRVEDGQGNLITAYTYGDDRPYTTERAGGQNKYIIDSGTHYWDKILVTEPSGALSTYAYRVELGRRVIDTITQTCTDCVPVNSAYAYDTNLNAIEEVVGSTKTCRNYDLARNLELTKVEGASTSFDCRTMTGGTFIRRTVSQWHPTLRKPIRREVFDSTGSAVTRYNWSYNERGQVLQSSQTDPALPASDPLATRTATWSYCTTGGVASGACPLAGLLLSVDGARTDVSDVTTYTYYASEDSACVTSPSTCAYRKGDLWKVTNALGQVARENLRYDGVGRLLSSKDANEVVTDLEYTAQGWIAASKVRGPDSASESDDAIMRYEYDPVGQVKKVIQPDGSYVRYEYDAARRLTDVFDVSGNQIHYTLDSAGNRIKEDTKDSGGALKRTLSRIYNQINQLKTAKTAYDYPTDFTYDPSGNGDVTTDALGRKSDNDYDPLNRLAKTTQDFGGINAKTEFKYDAQDRLITIKDPQNLDTSYGYNGFGDQVRLTSPDTGESSYTYDSVGNRKTETDARQITRVYNYDALNRITGIAYPTTSLNASFAYDAVPTVCAADETFAKGRLSLMIDASGSTQYCYDRFGRTTRKVQTTNGKVLALRYAYTLAGQLSGITYPDGAAVTYQRDSRGRITRIDTQRTAPGTVPEVLLSQATYHPFGSIASWVYGNGRTMSRPVDMDYRTTAVSDLATGGLSFGLGYDAIGNISKLTAVGATNAVLAYSYDRLNRLTHLRDGPTDTAIESYSYDAIGNRLSFTNTAGSQVYTYPANSHRLTQAGPGSPRNYDASGNSIQIGDKSFGYNDAGRSSEVKQSSALLKSYVYNGRGEQVRHYTGTSDRHVVYDEAGHWLGEYDGNGTVVQQAIWMDDLPIGLWVGAAAQQMLHYIEPDHLGTPRVVIEPARNLAIWTWDLKGEVFGNSSPNDDADSDGGRFVFDMRFPGQRYDAVSGLYYNYFRDYDPTIGRYLESDPIGLMGGVSTYAYVLSNPLIWTDPKGLFVVTNGNGGSCGGDNGITTCDGQGNLEVRNCNGTCTSACTQMHENNHARFLGARYPGGCKNKPKGGSPWPEELVYDQYVLLNAETECKAWGETMSCLKLLESALGTSCDEKCKRDIEAMKSGYKYWRKYYKCAAYSY